MPLMVRVAGLEKCRFPGGGGGGGGQSWNLKIRLFPTQSAYEFEMSDGLACSRFIWFVNVHVGGVLCLLG